MFLVQIFVPLSDPSGKRFPRDEYERLERDLTSKFNGFTAYPRAPATGLWKNSDAAVERDELVVYEVVAESIDRNWWQEFRTSLEHRMRQEKILIRSQEINIL
jgi:hypothetical protein